MAPNADLSAEIAHLIISGTNRFFARLLSGLTPIIGPRLGTPLIKITLFYHKCCHVLFNVIPAVVTERAPL